MSQSWVTRSHIIRLSTAGFVMKARAAVPNAETKDGRAEIMDYLFTVEWGRDKNKDYFDPLGFLDLYQPIQMSVAEISQYDWFNEDLYHPYYFQFSQA